MPTLPHTAEERLAAAERLGSAIAIHHHQRGKRARARRLILAGGRPTSHLLDGLPVLGLMVTAAEPFLRRQIFVPGEQRFSFARLESLMESGGLQLGDVLTNVFSQFRFRLEHLPRLLLGLKIPAEFTTRAGYKFAGEEGLLVLLARLHFPGTLMQLGEQAGRPPSALSECFGWMIEYVYNTFAHLRDWRSLAVHARNFAAYAHAIHERGAPLRFVCGFIDGKLQHVARPGRYQGVLAPPSSRWRVVMTRAFSSRSS